MVLIYLNLLATHLTLVQTYWYILVSLWFWYYALSCHEIAFISEACSSYHWHPRCVCCPQLLRCCPHSWVWLPKLKHPKASHPLLWIRYHEIYEGGERLFFFIYKHAVKDHVWLFLYSLLQNSNHDLNHEAKALKRLQVSGAILNLHPDLWKLNV